ncbi:MAG: anthranilate synthase component I family protein [Anaerolineae bacterium]
MAPREAPLPSLWTGEGLFWPYQPGSCTRRTIPWLPQLKSVTGGEQVARYSFICINPRRVLIFRGPEVSHCAPGKVGHDRIPPGQDLLDILRAELARYRPQPVPGLPRFSGGLAGYVSYDAARFFEPTLPLTGHPVLPDAVFLLADTVVAFDHAFGRLLLIANAYLDGDEAAARREAAARLDELEARILAPIPPRQPGRLPDCCTGLSSNRTMAEFTAAVMRAKQYIAAGDIFQVVLSQRFSRKTAARPFDIYRALRRLNPSPYMFFFDFNHLVDHEPFYLIGASPEMHVRLEGRRAALRPIVGTRPRGADPAADIALERKLLADPKERAEHVMLVDLARNDLGRVCRYGTVRPTELMSVERYSHVMHIVSHVEGELQPALDGFDLFRATFPAGTVSGAPKIRAMEIIQELEGEPRSPYAGAVGYFSFDGSLDTCITIRTLVMQGQTVSVQAGAGIVADSIPEREYQETINKAQALVRAVELAEGGRISESANGRIGEWANRRMRR